MSLGISPGVRLLLPDNPVRQPLTSYAVSAGLMNYWPLSIDTAGTNGSQYDLVRNKQLVLAGGSPNAFVDAPVGYGINFAGTSTSYLVNAAVQNQAIAVTTYPITVSIWTTQTAAQGVGNSSVLYAVQNTAGTQIFVFEWFETGGPVFGFRTHVTSGSNQRVYSLTFGTTPIVHLVGQFINTTTHALWLNGVQQTGTYTTAGNGAPNPTGLDNEYLGFRSTGCMNELKVYNRVLDATEIQELYQAGLNRTRYTSLLSQNYRLPELASAASNPAGSSFRPLVGLGV